VKIAVLAVVLAAAGMAQDEPFQRVVAESKRLREMPLPAGGTFWDSLKEIRHRSDGLHALLRDWMEPLLPQSRQALVDELPFVAARINADLARAGFLKPNGDDEQNGDNGLPSAVKFSRPLEAPDLLIATWGVVVPCGRYDVVYVYDYSHGAPRRVLETHGENGAETVSEVVVSKPDVYGGRLIAALRFPVQCGSSWSMLSYDLFQLRGTAETAAPLLSGSETIHDWDYQVRLGPDELLLEFTGQMIDTDYLERTHVLHFNATGAAAHRIDPVALQPQDFVDEWVTKPWTEMESRSGDLKKWHDFLAGGPDEYVGGTFDFVQPCQDKPGQWQIGVSFESLKGKELPEALPVYFLVQQSEQYKFQMTGISFDRPDGCPGETPLKDEHLSLFPPRQKQ